MSGHFLPSGPRELGGVLIKRPFARQNTETKTLTHMLKLAGAFFSSTCMPQNQFFD
jgi:hypothetical protein